MAFQFTKATKKQAKARIAIAGPAGSGKTFTALRLASAMCKRVALIDTEHGSAAKYAHRFNFDTLQLDDFHPDNYVQAIQAAQKAGYDGLVIDSASHEWSGKNGCLELVDLFAKRNKGGNNWAAWADVTPLHTGFIEAIHQADLHVFATFRSKMDYIQTEDNGKKKIQKVGMAPITREGAEYEFDIVLDLDIEHTAVITKSRCETLADKVIKTPGEDLAQAILTWLSDAEPQPRTTAPASSQSGQQPPAMTTPAANGSGDRLANLTTRWTALWNEAKQLGIDEPPVKFPCEEAALIEKGKTLAAKIAAKKAEVANEHAA